MSAPVSFILNHMVQYSQAHFNSSFAALADATVRSLERVGERGYDRPAFAPILVSTA